LIIRNYRALALTGAMFLVASAGFYWFWWRNLPAKNMYDDEECVPDAR
jgi:hypothetical protein